MKLSFLPATFCACLFACGETEVAETTTLEPEPPVKAAAKIESAPEQPAPEPAAGAGEPDQVPGSEVDSNTATLQLGDSELKRDSSGPDARAALGRPAPEFELKDLTGKLHKLSRYKGKVIVLEWFNPDCPFVVNAHEEGPLKEMAASYEAEGVVWIAINSGAPGSQDTSPRKNVQSTEEWKMKYPLLFDPTGEVGELYRATTTPHMFVIDEDFILRYAGALDNAPMGKEMGEYENFVKGSLDAISKGEPCPGGDKPYGCGIKYAD
jgi:peroxiredoxin